MFKVVWSVYSLETSKISGNPYSWLFVLSTVAMFACQVSFYDHSFLEYLPITTFSSTEDTVPRSSSHIFVTHSVKMSHMSPNAILSYGQFNVENVFKKNLLAIKL